jgi:HK97 family phage prohead protease
MDQEEQTQYLEASIEKASDGSFTAIASTNSIDRHGEVVDNNGWDLKAFKKNPVILWAHDHSEPAIGTAKKVWIEGAGKKAKLMIQPVLHDVTEKARAIKALVDQGIIKTLSVGFRPLESPDGVTFTQNELLEVSMVNVPANADAMMLAYKSLKTAGFEDEVIKDVGVQTELIDKLVVMEKDIADLKNMVKMQPHQSKKRSEERLSMLKIIAKTSDKILEADKKRVKVDKKNLVKVIKRATEIMTVAEKESLNG